MRLLRPRVVAALLLVVPALTLAAPPAATADLLTQARCSGERPTVSTFVAGGLPLLDWRENLEFDGHGMVWVSHFTANRVEGYTRDGVLRTTIPVKAPGGIRLGPDGMMYVNYGTAITPGDSGLARFDPAPATPVLETVVGGLSGGINGLAIDDAGNFYLARSSGSSVLKINADGTVDTEWSAAAKVFGSNGATIVDDTLYVTLLPDLDSSVVAIPLADPARLRTVADLGRFPLLFKALDDLAHVDGDLLVTAFGSGELLRVDPDTGKACVLVNGLRQPTSVRVPTSFGSRGSEVYVTEASGRIVRIAL